MLKRHPILLSVIFAVLVIAGLALLKVLLALGVVLLALAVIVLAARWAIAYQTGRARRRS